MKIKNGIPITIFLTFLLIGIACKATPAQESKLLPEKAKEAISLLPRKIANSDPTPTYTTDQQEQIDEAKKLLPKTAIDKENVRVQFRKTKLGNWITIAVWGRGEGGFTKYEIFKKGSGKPILFYKDERGIDIIPGNQGRLLFINDFFVSSGGVNVLAADLKSGKNWHIDKDAINDCMKKLKGRKLSNGKIMSGYRPFTVIAVSPDDRRALLKSEDDQLERDDKTEPLFYIVDTKTGKILETHKVKKPW